MDAAAESSGAEGGADGLRTARWISKARISAAVRSVGVILNLIMNENGGIGVHNAGG